ncbi:DNA/RNA non-specific endonuclease [Gryllus bimaculatus]|nr:DNA/RNA non-specific endonuclease [Gryllus bimaculatus]
MALMWAVLVTIAVAVGQTNAACSFRFTALQSAHPLLLADNEYTDVRRLLPVDDNANIVLATGANITLVCPGTYNYFLGGNTQPLQVMRATCDSGYNFVANGRTIVLNQATYVTTAQTQSFTRQLDSASAKKYITSSNYLEARLIVPKDDFVYGQLQLSAYFYINSAPMWRAVSSSYWGTMETAIRSLTKTDGDLLVYTTLIGVAELPNSLGELKPMHLYSNNGESYMPLPAILAKAVYNSRQEQIGRVCAEDVCAQLRWLPWRNVPAEERPSITCCRADDPVLLRHLPVAFARGLAPSTGLLVGQAEHYD